MSRRLLYLDKFKVYFCDSCKLIFHYKHNKLRLYYPKTYREYVGIVNYLVTLKSKYYVKKFLIYLIYLSINYQY